MQALHLVLTSSCNLRCAYCYQDRKPRRFMDGDTVDRAVRLLLRTAEPGAKLVLLGGEPLLAFGGLVRAVERAEAERPRGLRLRYETSTNGTLLEGDRTAFLARHRVVTQVSFDGLPPAQDRRQPGSFPLLDGRLRELRRTRPEFFAECVEVAVTVTGAGLPSLADSVEYLLGLGVRTIHLSPCLPPDPTWTGRCAAELERQMARVCRVSRGHFASTGRVPVALLRPGAGARRWRRAAMCTIGAAKALAVDVDGEIRGCTPCVASYQSFNAPGMRRWIAPLRIGEVGAPDLDEGVRAFAAAVRRSALFGRRTAKRVGRRRCASCPLADRCFVCPVAIARIPGNLDPHRIPESHCAFNRATLRHAGHVAREPVVGRRLGRGSDPPLVRELLARWPPRVGGR